MPAENALDYDELKAKLQKRILRKYCVPEKGETCSQFVVRLESYIKRWIEMAEIDKSFGSLLGLMVRGQFLNICNKELTLFLLKRIPNSSAQMAKLAVHYCDARFLPVSLFVFCRNEHVK
jgi:hypothetical protein